MRDTTPGDGPFERRMDDEPEGKLELMDGRLIVGNGIAGSRYLLWSLLDDLDLRAALALVPLDVWWQALRIAFEPPQLATAQEWLAWADAVNVEPGASPAGPRWHGPHYTAATNLRMGLYGAAQHGGLGTVLGRDFVMRLGEDAATPDVLLVRADRIDHLHDYYVDGPADVVIEVTMPGHAQHDEVTKRRLYAAHRVPEYWIINPDVRAATLLRLIDGAYQPQTADADGRYQPSNIAGLVFRLDQLWALLDETDIYRSSLGDTLFETDSAPAQRTKWEHAEPDLGWGELPFAPQIGLEHAPLSFAQYISWCPQAKFERIDSMPLIGGYRGTRNVLGMLLMTFGLVEAMQLHHPRGWVQSLLHEEDARRQDAATRDVWWALARRAATLLREKHGMQRLAVIGDLVRPQPLHFWSEIQLVAWDMPRRDHELYHDLYKLSDTPHVNLVDATRATSAKRTAIAREAVEL